MRSRRRNPREQCHQCFTGTVSISEAMAENSRPRPLSSLPSVNRSNLARTWSKREQTWEECLHLNACRVQVTAVFASRNDQPKHFLKQNLMVSADGDPTSA